MIPEWMTRTELLLGEEKMSRLIQANVLIVGLGGVGSFAAESLVRAGIGAMTIVDGDTVDASNRNRQIPALTSTQDKWKTEVLSERLLDINPDIQLTARQEFLRADLCDELLEQPFDYVVDAIDTLDPKVQLISRTIRSGKPLVSSCGAGGKIDPTKVEITDISKTHTCTLTRAVRKRLYNEGIRQGIKVVFSPERFDKSRVVLTDGSYNKKSFLGTISYLPAVFGCCCASVVIRDIIRQWQGYTPPQGVDEEVALP
jgi:tRNA A37 threonylcarbamoyladenosine dehydratase